MGEKNYTQADLDCVRVDGYNDGFRQGRQAAFAEAIRYAKKVQSVKLNASHDASSNDDSLRLD